MFYVLANQGHKLVQEQILVSMKCFRHCSKCYNSELKNIPAKEKSVEKLFSSTNRKEALIVQDMDLQNFNPVQQPIKHLGFQSKLTWYKRKTLKHDFWRDTFLRSERFLYLLLFQASTGDHTHTTCTGGIKLQTKLQLLKIKGMNWRFMLEKIHIKEV